MMTDGNPPRYKKISTWLLSALALVLVFVVIAYLGVRPGNDQASPTTGAPSNATTASDDSSAGRPVVAEESTSLTVPDTLRLEPRDFEAVEGATYLLQFAATTTKPVGSPGDAMYFGAGLGCSGPDGATLRSVGGTQNVRTGETVTIRNQFLLEIDEPGRHLCRITLNSPNEEAAAVGTTAKFTSSWSVTEINTTTSEARADLRLPRVADAGQRALAFRHEIDLGNFSQRRVGVMSTLHLTTCTGVNGSRENGREWCLEESVDAEGSTLEISYRVDVLDEGGEVCESRMLATTPLSIDEDTHHHVVHEEHVMLEPLGSCGNTAVLNAVVENFGPAPVVIHQSNSTFLAFGVD